MVDLNNLLISDLCECSCSDININIIENDKINSNFRLVNLLGEYIQKPVYNSPYIKIYNDGSIEKIFITKSLNY
jgi:hypothetical protein